MRRTALAGCMILALGLRICRVLEHPFIAQDGPGYIQMAESDIRPSRWRAAIAGYYPPLFPAALRALHAAGLGWEAAGQAVAVAAGVAVVPATARLATVLLGPDVGVGTAALAAVHPKLTHASGEVLPETLHALVVALWALYAFGGGATAARLAAAGVIAGLAGLVRPEGVLLVPLTALAAICGAPPRARFRRLALASLGAAAIVIPQLVGVRLAIGEWRLSGKEATVAVHSFGVHADTLLRALLDHPGAFLAAYPLLIGRQLLYTFAAAHVLVVVAAVPGFAAPLADASARRGRTLTLSALLVLTLAIGLNPGKRYAIPLLPLVLPWAILGAGRLRTLAGAGAFGRAGSALCRRAAIVAALALVVLAVEGLRPPDRSKEPCYRRVCAWVGERFAGTPPAIMAEDGRIAYLCGTPFILEGARADRETTGEVARRRGALWIARRHGPWPGPTFEPLAEFCGGRLRAYAAHPGETG